MSHTPPDIKYALNSYLLTQPKEVDLLIVDRPLKEKLTTTAVLSLTLHNRKCVDALPDARAVIYSLLIFETGEGSRIIQGSRKFT